MFCLKLNPLGDDYKFSLFTNTTYSVSHTDLLNNSEARLAVKNDNKCYVSTEIATNTTGLMNIDWFLIDTL